ncbi:MAG TPA: hypothetical protein VN843_17480, partial [Anaerolineales bacterium]|nr:hypothetical protein [Anaerolineales bacterium]
MKKLSALLLFIAFTIPACTFNVEVLTPEIAFTPTALTSTEAAVTIPTSVATVTVTAESPATPTQVLSAPQFSNARFTV